MPIVSHDVLARGRAVTLSPFATFREAGDACEAPKSAVRALQILELMALHSQPKRAIEIGRLLGLSPSSASELLKALTDRGFLIFDPITKEYFVSPRFGRLAGDIDEAYFGRGAIDRVMAGLRHAFCGMILLSAPHGGHMQVQDCIATEPPPPRKPFAGWQDKGFQVSTFGTSTGAAWLLTRDEPELRSLMHLCRRELGSMPVDRSAVIANIREFAAQGYAFGGISEDDGWRALAMPLPPSRDGVVLVLSLYGERAEMEARREMLVARIRELIGAELR